jgi:hypothetical protein
MSRLVSGSVAWRRMLRTIRVVRSQLIAELCKKVVQTVQKGGGASIMPTAKEYRLEAKAFLELADQANEFYVKTALIELARDYNRPRAKPNAGNSTRMPFPIFRRIRDRPTLQTVVPVWGRPNGRIAGLASGYGHASAGMGTSISS